MRILERALISLPYAVTDRVLFGFHPLVRPLQVLVQHLIGGPRSASFLLDGHTFNCSTAEKYFFEREHFEQELWSVLSNFVGSQDIVYDFGAHIGFWALRLSRVCRHVVAFEPSPVNFQRLQRNVSNLSNITLVNAALAAAEGEFKFTEAGSMSALGGDGAVVKATTLDLAATRYPAPTFLLMDVEGHADEVLRGGTSLLRQKVPMICEIHSEQEERPTLQILREWGYEISRIDHAHQYPFRIGANSGGRTITVL